MRTLPAGIERHRFDVDEYHKMLEVGLLHEDDRVELIGGEIVDTTPIGGPHFTCVTVLTHLLVEASGGKYFVSVQNPVRLGVCDEPEPDLVLLKERPGGEPPVPDDVLIVIEVSDTSLAYDRNVKLPLYAEAGIPEVWIVDFQGRKVETYSEPANGNYRNSRPVGPGERIRASIVEGLELSADEIIGG